MRIFAHRGNLDGPGSDANAPAAIRACLDLGLSVEADIRRGPDGRLWIGHDRAEWPAPPELLAHPDVMWHAKDVEAVPRLRQAGATFFCLEHDAFALCSNGLIWANYGCAPTPVSIMCSPELVGAPEPIEQFAQRVVEVHGVCTDFPLRYRQLLNG